MNKSIFYISILTLLIGISSCGSKLDDYNPTNNDSNYYPIGIGNTWIYSLDSIVYDNKGAVVDTFKHIVKETIIDTFIDNEGLKEYTIHRYNKKGNSWKITDKWSTSKDEFRVIRSEDNLRFIKMVFPATVDKTWDGNAYIDTENVIVKIAGESIKMFEQWSYRYLRVNEEETINDILYNDVITIEQVDTENPIQKRFSIEKYAKNYGLIYKKMIILNSQNTDSSIPWEDKAEEGFILEQKLISFQK